VYIGVSHFILCGLERKIRLLGIGGEEDGAGYIGTKYKDNIKSEIAWDVHDHHSILFVRRGRIESE